MLLAVIVDFYDKCNFFPSQSMYNSIKLSDCIKHLQSSTLCCPSPITVLIWCDPALSLPLESDATHFTWNQSVLSTLRSSWKLFAVHAGSWADKQAAKCLLVFYTGGKGGILIWLGIKGHEEVFKHSLSTSGQSFLHSFELEELEALSDHRCHTVLSPTLRWQSLTHPASNPLQLSLK